MRLIRSELRRLRRPITAVALLTLVLAAVSVQFLAQNEVFAADFTEVFEPFDCSGDVILQEGPTCEELNEVRQSSFEQSQAIIDDRQRSALLLRHPIGALRAGAGTLASLPGAVVIMFLAGAHVGGEWSARTITSVILHQQSRWRFLAGKATSLWLLAVLALVPMWVALIAAGPLLPDATGSVPTREAWAAAWPSVLKAPVVLLVFVGIGLAASLLTQSALGGAGAGIAVLAASFVLAEVPRLGAANPAYWIASWMDFDRGTDNIWFGSFGGAELDPTTGLMGLIGVIAFCGLTASARFLKMDLDV